MYTIAQVKIRGISPLQQSREKNTRVPKNAQETDPDYEKRTWMERAHLDPKGNVVVPGGAIKQALVSASKYVGAKIPGQGSKTYTQKFQSGICVINSPVVGRAQNIEGRWVYAASNGKHGAGTRVWKCFPTLVEWAATFEVTILDEIITPEIFEEMVKNAGRYIGIGTWRPERGGEYGRFDVMGIQYHRG